MDYDFCSPDELNHLNLANNEREGFLCLKDAENQLFKGEKDGSVILKFKGCD